MFLSFVDGDLILSTLVCNTALFLVSGPIILQTQKYSFFFLTNKTLASVKSKYALFDRWRSGQTHTEHTENFDQQLPAKQTDLESICHVSRCIDMPVLKQTYKKIKLPAFVVF